MDSFILACSFAAAVVISACVVLLFSGSIDEALARVVPAEMSAAWSRYVKFGLFTVTFAGGMRLSEFADFVGKRAPGAQETIGAGQGLLEILKTIAGSLVAAASVLLVFFVATLAVYALSGVYRSYRMTRATAVKPPAPPAKPLEQTQRAVGSERHAAAGKERAHPQEPGRFL